jgi:hypothetical protein
MGSTILKTLLPLALTIVCLGAQSSLAAEKCYETVLIPTQTDCRSSQSRSADFVSGCTVSPARTEQREVECQVTDRWVNVTADTSYGPRGESLTHTQLCSAVGLTPSNIGGVVCASGDKPVISGAGWESIDYKFGRQSGGRYGGFGVQGVEHQDMAGGNDGDSGAGAQTYEGTMCVTTAPDSPGYFDQLSAVVAVACR